MTLVKYTSKKQAKKVQTKPTHHPAFEESDSEEDDGKTKAERFQELLRQDALESSSIPDSSSRKEKHPRLLHILEAPFKHIIQAHQDKKAEFLMVNNAEVPPMNLNSTTLVEKATANHASIPAQATTTPAMLQEAIVSTFDSTITANERNTDTFARTVYPQTRRRFTVGEAPMTLHEYPFGRDNPAILAAITNIRGETKDIGSPKKASSTNIHFSNPSLPSDSQASSADLTPLSPHFISPLSNTTVLTLIDIVSSDPSPDFYPTKFAQPFVVPTENPPDSKSLFQVSLPTSPESPPSTVESPPPPVIRISKTLRKKRYQAVQSTTSSSFSPVEGVGGPGGPRPLVDSDSVLFGSKSAILQESIIPPSLSQPVSPALGTGSSRLIATNLPTNKSAEDLTQPFPTELVITGAEALGIYPIGAKPSSDTTSSSPPITRFERPRLKLMTEESTSSSNPPVEKTITLKRSNTSEKRSKLRKPYFRDVKISAPTSVVENSSAADIQTLTSPRTPPLPPGFTNVTTISKTAARSPQSPEGRSSLEELLAAPPSISQVITPAAPSTSSPQTARKKSIRLQTIARVAGHLLHRQSTADIKEEPVQTTSRPKFPALRYTASMLMEEHMLAISSRVKDEFKLKLNGQFEIPKKNAATEGELMEDLNDINNEIGRRVKDVIRLVSRGEKKGRKSTQFEKETLSLEKSMRTSLNVFLVTHIFTPYSIELDEVDDEKMRKRYDEIAPKVPQMIASRWRVLASASTSRPADQLNPIFTKLASEASDILLEGREADEKVRNEMLAILIPLVQQAYLLAHFIHLEMIESDYDVFFGTEIGGWLNHTLEEDYRVKPKSAMSLEGRIDGHWSLGLRKKRYIGEGTQQRRIWDALVKAKVSTQSG